MSMAALAAGVAALCAAAAMNVAFGSTIAASEKGQTIYSAASFVCAVAGTLVFGMMTGRLVRERRWARAIFPAFILILATLWDIVTVVGFNATEQLSAAAHYRLAFDREKEAADARKKHAEKLVGVATIRAPGISRAQRKEFLEAASAEIDKVATVGTSIKLLPAALAEMIARRTTMSVEDVQFTLFFYMAILLILIQSTGFTFTTLLDDRVSVASIPASPHGGADDDAASGGSGGGRKRIKLVSDAGDAAQKPAAKSAMQPASHELTQRSAPDASVPAVPVKMPEPELRTYLRSHASGMSQRQIAAATGWSQPSVCRKSRQVRRQEERVARKAARASNEATAMNGYPGFGGRMHSPASI